MIGSRGLRSSFPCTDFLIYSAICSLLCHGVRSRSFNAYFLRFLEIIHIGASLYNYFYIFYSHHCYFCYFLVSLPARSCAPPSVRAPSVNTIMCFLELTIVQFETANYNYPAKQNYYKRSLEITKRNMSILYSIYINIAYLLRLLLYEAQGNNIVTHTTQLCV